MKYSSVQNQVLLVPRLYPCYRFTAPNPGFGAVRKMHRPLLTSGDICRKAAIDGIRFHDLRHTHATLLMKQGTNPKVVQESLGHSRICNRGGDGFMLSPIYCPGAIEEFVDIVVPELQRRGPFRTSYTGLTQRDHLLQQD